MIVGGYAVLEYTEPRYTKPLDIGIAADPTNCEALFEVLREFGAPLQGLTPAHFTWPYHFYQVGAPPNRVDILTSIPGVEFESAYSRKRAARVDGATANFIAPEDLLASKLGSGRPQDMIDADGIRAYLESNADSM